MDRGEEPFAKELDVAVKAVHLASSLCQRVQQRLSAKETNGAAGHVLSKDDDSPVTVADWGVQATVSWLLSQCFGTQNVDIVAEEDVDALSKADSVNLLNDVVNVVNECLEEAPIFDLQKPKTALTSIEVLEAIERCNATAGPKGRFWVLDPVDGTLGFVRGNQYAVALALIEDGKVVLGVLGCPNYPMNKELLSYHHKCCQNGGKNGDLWGKGCVIYAMRGSGKALMQPLIRKDMNLHWPYETKLLRVSKVEDPSVATFCESVEKTNTNQSFAAGLAHTVGFRNQPLRVYSMVKYAAIARGDAEVFMKFARCGYKEKIWDHAAGVVIVEEAGGVVTDAGGRPLDFSKGVYLEGLDRGIVACCGSILHEKLITGVYASWDSSNL